MTTLGAGLVAAQVAGQLADHAVGLVSRPPWPLVFTLLAVAAILTIAGLILLVRSRGGRS